MWAHEIDKKKEKDLASDHGGTRKITNRQVNPRLISQPISLTDFYSDHLLGIPKEYEIADDEAALQYVTENMQLDLGISANLMASLKSDCSFSSLMCENEPVLFDNILGLRPNDSKGLETLRRWRTFERTESIRFAKKDYSYISRLKALPKDLSYMNSRENGSTECVGSSYQKETLLTVLIMKPLKKSPLGVNQLGHCKAMQRLEVLGRQTLADLKDRITCQQDEATLGDCSECLDALPKDVVAKELYPSSYFFIGNTFYSDLRYPNQQDLTGPVVEWIRNSQYRRKIWGDVTTKTMDSVHFRELTIRIGEPYLYVHQGDCEHLVVFSDLRMLGPHDCQDPLRYPLLTGFSTNRNRLCKICQREQSKWYVMGCDLLPEEPCFMCESCMRMLLYDKEGRKKYSDFKVFAVPRANPGL